MDDFAIPPELNKQLEEIEKKKAEIMAEKEREEFEEQEKIEVTEEEVSDFWSAMIKKQAFVEVYEIRGLTFSLKTRKANEIQQAMRKMDEMALNLPQTMEYFQVEAILACSLNSFGDDKLDGDLSERITYVRSLPSPVIRLLTKKLDEFDAKVMKLTEVIETGNF